MVTGLGKICGVILDDSIKSGGLVLLEKKQKRKQNKPDSVQLEIISS